ncbi:MAG TPA: GNAT family N-acetyltransferase [Thermoleophilaceae bacterium]|jgi:ribosomal protein S18 acetylase RimI-like enzyme
MSTSTPDAATAVTNVRPATAADVPRLAAAVARGYQDDPVWSFLMPDERRRSEGLPRYFEIELRHVVLPHGATWTTDDLVGGTLCAPPGHWRLSPLTMLVRGPAFVRALGRDLPRLLGALSLIERRHPREDHYYVAYTGIEPESQGRGLGGELVRPLLRRCDAEAVPAYLEATSERAAAFYERKGFAVTEEIRIRNGPPMWLMWREPRSGEVTP